jgi:hypothetical protein
MMNEEYLTATELAERWRVDLQVLAKLRKKRQAPAYMKIGSGIRYPISEILKIEACSLEEFI